MRICMNDPKFSLTKWKCSSVLDSTCCIVLNTKAVKLIIQLYLRIDWLASKCRKDLGRCVYGPSSIVLSMQCATHRVDMLIV